MGNVKSKYSITIFGQKSYHRAQVGCYVELLQALHSKDDSFLQRLSQHKDRKLRLVARRIEDIHTDHERPEFIERFARRIQGGWWIWTNLSGKHVRRNIVAACVYAHVNYGTDVLIDYESWGLSAGDLDDLLA